LSYRPGDCGALVLPMVIADETNRLSWDNNAVLRTASLFDHTR
jgi:hypothetical protein